MKVILLVLFLIVNTIPAFCQDDVEVTVQKKNPYDSLRSEYIQTFPDHFFIWPVLKKRSLSFDMTSLTTKKKLTYQSNNPYSFGVGVYLFELGLELTFAVPVDEKDKLIYGESDASDLQLNIIGKKWGGDVYIQKYSGFYIDDKDIDIPIGTPYDQRGDIDTRNFGAAINYTFNNKKFSFRSAYNFADRQLRSAGSFLLFGSLNSFKVSADSAILGSDHETDFGEAAYVKKVTSTSLSIAPGYTYSLIYKGFFLNGTLAIGPAHNWLFYESEDGSTKNDIRFNAYVAARIGLGYNGERFFGGVTFVNQARTAKFENLEVTSSFGTFKILVGYRFREFGILKKRIWDFPAELLK